MTTNLVDYLRFWGWRYPERDSVRFRDRRLTWREFDRTTDEIAAGLVDLGVRPGDVVSILMGNRIEFVQTLLGVLKVGAVAGLHNPRLTPQEIAYQISDAGSTIAVTEPDLAGQLAEAEREVAKLRVITTDPLDGATTLTDVMIPGEHVHCPAGADDVALLSYTSGTTGRPKGAMLTHGSILGAAYSRIIADGITAADRLLITTPLALAGPVSYFLRESLVTGSTVVLESGLDGAALLQVIERERITNWGSVPVVFETMMNHPNFGATDLSSLRCVQAGGSPVPLNVLHTWQARGVRMSQGYGQTETSGGCVTILYPDEAEARAGSAGRAMLHHEVRIVDADLSRLPPGEVGEIMVRGPSLMKGYLNQPCETAAVLVDGWLRTGDCGLLDDEGYLTVTGRARDVLISGGFNVYPAEVELVLAGVAGIDELAVIGVPDPKWGQVPMLVVPFVEAVDVGELLAACRSKLAGFKNPKYLVGFGAPLPRNSHGKLLKSEIVARFPDVPTGARRLDQNRGD